MSYLSRLALENLNWQGLMRAKDFVKMQHWPDWDSDSFVNSPDSS